MPRFRITGEADIGYYLVLNMMRNRAESQTPFGPYESEKAALAFHDGELAPEPYTEDGPDGYDPRVTVQFRKTFKKGGPLEWMNPLSESERHQPGIFGHGVHRFIENLDIKSQELIG